MMQANTNDISRNISIHPRDRHFDFDQVQERDWHSGDPVKTLIFNGLSITFPAGERFFIRSVRRFQKRLSDPVLMEQVKSFVTQEAQHTREHVNYNSRMEAQGYRVSMLEDETYAQLNLAEQKLSETSQLAVTCALEHFTAILAHELLTNEALLENANPEYRDIWLWHAIEEAEHKGVAYDVMMQVTQGRCYWKRTGLMLIVSGLFFARMSRTYGVLMKDVGLSGSVKHWSGLFGFLWGKPGLFRGMFMNWLQYFKPGFHPWDHDNRNEMQTVSQTLYPETVTAN